MRRLLFLSLIFAAAALGASAQSLEAFRAQLAQPQVSGLRFGEARVTVTEHGDAAQAVAQAARSEQRLHLRGYRVCIFFDNGQDARAGAEAAKTLFEETYPGIKVYMVYESPWFSVSVGNCLTAEEAIILKGKVAANVRRYEKDFFFCHCAGCRCHGKLRR